MKAIKLLLAFLLLSFFVSAQAPQLFNYQATARDASGNVLANKAIGLKISILDGSPTGTVLYSETFTPTTNQFGLFTLAVGGGAVVSGNFSTITWGAGSKYLQTNMDPAGGTSYSLTGTSQLLSVPYALNASGGWSLTGNSGTTASNFIGTTDNPILNFKVGNKFAGLIDTTSSNTFFGMHTGENNTGSSNSNFGDLAGDYNTTGYSNANFGFVAGGRNTTGYYNANFGSEAGTLNAIGIGNNNFGYNAGGANTTGDANCNFGAFANVNNNSGNNNCNFGSSAGEANTGAGLQT